MSLKGMNWGRWIKLVGALAGFVAFSLGTAYLFQTFFAKVQLPLYNLAWLAYLAVFLSSLLCSLSLVVPAPIGLSVTLTAATLWNPLLVGLTAGLGTSIGELSGYYAGSLGRKMFLKETFMCSLNRVFCISQISESIQRYGPWTIGVLAVQPILPFDIGGIIAGTMKMPLLKFFVAMLAGKTIKYVVLALAAGLIVQLPFFMK